MRNKKTRFYLSGINLKTKVVIERIYEYVRVYRKYCSSCSACSRGSRA